MEQTELGTYPLNQIYFYLTGGCNLRCRHCWIDPKYQAADVSTCPCLPLDLFSLIIKQAMPLGLSGVKLTGGEPLLHPNIHKIIEIVKINNIRLIVETNGVLCTPELAQDLATSLNPFVSVSLDGVDAETHEWVRGVSGSFQSALLGIRNLIEAGLPPQIIMTVMRKNAHQLEDMVRLAEDLGAESVKFNIVQPTARGEALHRSNETLTIYELVEIGQWVEETLCTQTKLRLIFSHPHAFRPLGKLFEKNGGGCATCGILGIIGVLADGSYALCGIGQTVPDMVFGKAGDDHIRDVWLNTPFLNEIRHGLPEKLEGLCQRCLMKQLCRGQCIAQNVYRQNHVWAPYWYCEEAWSADLFPYSRLKNN